MTPEQEHIVLRMLSRIYKSAEYYVVDRKICGCHYCLGASNVQSRRVEHAKNCIYWLSKQLETLQEQEPEQ